MLPRPRSRILVVDDEPAIVDAVATALRYEGFDVDEAFSGSRALAEIRISAPDLVVLDVSLPDRTGLEVTEALRFEGIDCPIIFLTARDSLEDKVTGLALGGDDYLTKPFALVELVARVNAVLRRRSTAGVTSGVLQFADLELNEAAHELRRSGALIDLTATEFNILRFFMLNPRQVLSKVQILDYVWHYDFSGNSNVVEVYVSALRRKLDKHGPSLIQTKRLVGYMLKEPIEEV